MIDHHSRSPMRLACEGWRSARCLAARLGVARGTPYNLREDAGTAEICRTQLWQWLRFEAELDT